MMFVSYLILCNITFGCVCSYWDKKKLYILSIKSLVIFFYKNVFVRISYGLFDFNSHKSSLQCHMILQKSFQNVDLVSKQPFYFILFYFTVENGCAAQ